VPDKIPELILDRWNREIINNFYNARKDMEFPEMVKKILQCKKIRNTEYNFVDNRIKKMTKKNIFEIGRNSPLKYSLILDKSFIQRFTFPTRRAKGMAVEVDGKFQIFED